MPEPTVPEVVLRAADATLPEGFTRVSSVRGMADGRVLVADDRLPRVVVADFRPGAVSDLGRKGRGPGEYTQVDRLWATGSF